MKRGFRRPTYFETAVVRRDWLGRFAVFQSTTPEIMRAAYGSTARTASRKGSSWLANYLIKNVR